MTTLTDTQVITASGGLVELGYGPYSAGNIVISSTSPTSPNTVIPALSVVCDGSPVAVEFFAPQVLVGGGAAGSAVYVSLWRDGSEIRRYWGVGGDTVGTLPMRLDYRDVPSAGAHTYSVTAHKAAGNDTTFVTGSTATAQAPAFLRVSKIVQATQWPAVTTGTIICTSSTRPASPFQGQRIYETDTKKEWVYDGASWYSPGLQGYSEVTAVQTGIGTSVTDLTGLSVSWTAVASRQYLVSGFATFYSTGGAVGDMSIRTGTTTVAAAQNPINGGYYSSWPVVARLTGISGSVTYKLSANSNTSTMVMQASVGRPASILVQDIGPA